MGFRRAVVLMAMLALFAAALSMVADSALAAAKPGKPTAKTPNSTSIVTTTQPTFKWGHAARATRYEVRVYKGSALQIKKTGISRLSWKSSKVLARGVVYTWKVRGRKAGVNGAWSRSLKFTVASSAKAITAFSFSSPAGTGVINETFHTIAVTVPYGTNVSALVATFTTTGASVKVGATPQVSGTTANDFSGPVTYTVGAANRSAQNYVVTVTIAAISAKVLTAFSFEGLAPPVVGTVNEAAHTIALTVPYGTAVTALVPTITITGASVSPASGVAHDFTSPATYTVTAADATTQDYTVTVTVAALAIGDAHGGGIVAYIDGTGVHGLIAAAADQTPANDGIHWAIKPNWNTSVPGALGTAIGTGAVNTDAIIAQNGAGTSYAAGLARACAGGGYTDWFLPSKDELNQLYLNRVAIGGFTTSPQSDDCPYYWSSSQIAGIADGAWYQGFDDGYQYHYNYKYATARVRAIRAF